MTKLLLSAFHLLAPSISPLLFGADALKSKSTYAKAYGETKNLVTVDAAKDLPHNAAVDLNARWLLYYLDQPIGFIECSDLKKDIKLASSMVLG